MKRFSIFSGLMITCFLLVVSVLQGCKKENKDVLQLVDFPTGNNTITFTEAWVSVAVHSTVKWTVTSNQTTWCQPDISAWENDGSVVLHCFPNLTSGTRTAQILFSGEGVDPITFTMTQYSGAGLLSSNDWIMVADSINPPLNGNRNLYDSIPLCSRDDLYQFSASLNGTSGYFVIDEGPTKCLPTDPQTVCTSPWTCTDFTQTLAITYCFGNCYIQTLDAQTLRFRIAENISGTNYQETFVFHHP